MQFGSLSHSHLNQVLKNISGGVKYNAPSIVGPDGTIALNLLAARDHAFADHVQNGLMWDVLGWEMEDEEPDACTVVQAAMNSKNNTYLVMHEMQAFSHLSRLCKKSSAVAEELDFKVLREKVRSTLPEFAEQPDFLGLFRFVVDMGGDDASFVKGLRLFHQKFVDPKSRRLALGAFTAVCEIPPQMPHLKIAVLKAAYACDKKEINHTWVRHASKGDLTKLAKDTKLAQKTETCLQYFHGRAKDVFGSEESPEAIKFVGCCDKALASAALKTKAEIQDVEVAATAWLEQMKKLGETTFAGRTWPKPPWRARASPPKPEVTPKNLPELKPKLLQFDAQGNIQRMQEERPHISTFEILSWRTWHEAPALRQTLYDDMAKSVLLLAVQRLFLDMPTPKGVDLVRRKGQVSCVASMDLEPRSLRIAPVVTGRHYIVTKTTHPNAIFVQVPLSHDMSVPLYIVPEFKLPTTPTLTADMPVRNGEAALTNHDWAHKDAACLFWAVQRGQPQQGRARDDTAPSDAPPNASFELVDVVTISGIEPTESLHSVTTQIPIITNTRAIASGDVIYLPPTAPKPKLPPPSKAQTWLTDLIKDLKRKSKASCSIGNSRSACIHCCDEPRRHYHWAHDGAIQPRSRWAQRSGRGRAQLLLF